jgi:hypothetical protein
MGKNKYPSNRLNQSFKGDKNMENLPDEENKNIIDTDYLSSASDVIENTKDEIEDKNETFEDAVPEETLGEEAVPETNTEEEVMAKSTDISSFEKDSVEYGLTEIINPAQNLTADTVIKSWEVKSSNDILRSIIENIFNEYEKNMRPKRPIDPNKGGELQTTLYQTLVRVAQTNVNFNENWSYILSRFYENPNGVYNINYVLRFVDKMNVTKQDLTLFTRLINLLIVTCDRSKIKDNLRKVSLEKTLADVASNNIRSNILGFYRQFVA